jgi:LysM repeat protein
MKKILFCIVLVLSNCFAIAQGNVLTHIVKQGENISVIARQYACKVVDILSANGIAESSILKIGQKLTIPLGKPNKKTETLAVVPHNTKGDYLIVKGDLLSRICKKFGVDEKDVMAWNNLKNDNIRAGDYLIVTNPTTKKIEPQSAVSASPEIKKNISKEEIITPKNVVVIPKKVDTIVKISKPKTVIVAQPKQVVVTPKAIDKVVEVVTPKNNNSNKSFFESDFISTSNSTSGTASTFKSLSGWHDKKYYVLLNNSEVGSIVKVTVGKNQVYAKVLGKLPNIKEDNNLLFRINSAALEALAVPESKFEATIEF